MNPTETQGVKGGNEIIDASFSPEEMRGEVLRATRDFKNSWRALAKALHIVWKNKLYTRWGYEKFDEYTAKEVFVRKNTAMKLIRSYMFLKNEGLPYQPQRAPSTREGELSLEAVRTLQRAKRSLPQEDYRNVREDILNKRDVGEVKKDLTSLIVKRRKDVDPEETRTRNARVAVKRFLAVLRSFRRDVEVLAVLPGEIAEDIGRLIEKIEKLSG